MASIKENIESIPSAALRGFQVKFQNDSKQKGAMVHFRCNLKRILSKIPKELRRNLQCYSNLNKAIPGTFLERFRVQSHVYSASNVAAILTAKDVEQTSKKMSSVILDEP